MSYNNEQSGYPLSDSGYGYGYVSFPFLFDQTYNKPNKYDKDEYPTINEQYYLRFAKWAVFDANETRHSLWLNTVYNNKQFYKGDQWRTPEDIESFLMDDSGETRNRIKIILNQIRPMVEQYRGNAIRLSLGASAKSVSNNVKNRRETALKKQLLTTDIANEFEALGEAIRENDKSIGETTEKTEQIFENTYVDEYTKNINRLIRFSSEFNDMEEFKVKIAENLALSGIGIIEEFRHGDHLRKEVVQPEEYFFDRNAKRYDHQDAAYKGRISNMVVPDIYERWGHISLDDKKAIERYIASNPITRFSTSSNSISHSNNIPVYKVFFTDDMTREVGYVLDDFDQPYLVYLNEEDDFNNGKIWTEDDLIEPPKSAYNGNLFRKGEKKRKVTVSVLRYCIFIPGEAIAYYKQGDNEKKKWIDVVLEYGEYPYQETQWRDLSNTKYPLKTYCWGYVDGEIISPVDDIINPQRFLNRVMSAVEGQVNNSGGAGLVYDKSMVQTYDEEMEILKNANAGKPIGLNTRGRGVPNSVGNYDNTVKQGTYNMFGLLPSMKQMMQDITGVNEGLRGESTGSDQLVGVTQLMIQRGSLMQEPFYNAIAQIFTQSHQSTATVGKDIYIENERELNIAVGEDGVEVFKLAKGMKNEDFRVFIKRSLSSEQMQEQANSALLVLLQSNLIDEAFFADSWGRDTMDEIQTKYRAYVNKKLLAAKMQAEEAAAAAEQANQQAAAAEQAAIAAAQEEKRNDQILEVAKAQDSHTKDLEKILMAETAKANNT